MRLRLIPGIGVTVRAAGAVSAQINDEYRVKAVFPYNLVKFVEWLPDAWPAPGDPITVCALRTSPLGGAVAQVVEWKTVRGQPLCPRPIGPWCAARTILAGVHVRFVSPTGGDTEIA